MISKHPLIHGSVQNQLIEAPVLSMPNSKKVLRAMVKEVLLLPLYRK
jgi:hypothetical protein